MRYPQEHKADTRRKIVDAASRAFRRHGAAGVSVSQIMAKAGLTVGGFYRHFDSKDELFQEALEKAMDESRALLRRADGSSKLRGDEWLLRAATIYLSPTHRDMHDTGCPLPALTAEVGRRGEGVRQSFAESLQVFVEKLAGRIDAASPEAGRMRALGFLSTIVGSMLLARGVGDDQLSQEIRNAGRWATGQMAEDDAKGTS